MNSTKHKKSNKVEDIAVLEQTEKDIAFRERLKKFDKDILAMWVSMGVDGQQQREWLIGYLMDLENLLVSLNVVDDRPVMDMIYRTMLDDTISHEAEFGDANLNPKRLDSWTHDIANLADDAQIHARVGRDSDALNTLMKVLREGFRCLEHFIEKGADAGIEDLRNAIDETFTAPPVEKDAEISPEKTIDRNGILFQGHYYWASWMADRQGDTVRVKTPSDPQSVTVVESPHIHQVIGLAHRVDISELEQDEFVSPKGMALSDKNKKADDAATSPAEDSVTNNSN